MSLEIQTIPSKLVSMVVKLTVGEIGFLKNVVSRSPARGGFQNLLLHLSYRLDEDTGELEIPGLLLERINRYAFAYGNPTWRRTLRRLFRRTLGVNLDRGLTLR
jgi:hypothetical protein